MPRLNDISTSLCCVQLPPSADNVTLLAFAAERCAAAALGGRYTTLSIDISCLPGPQQQTRRSGMHPSVDRWDRQTDGLRTVIWTLPHIRGCKQSC